MTVRTASFLYLALFAGLALAPATVSAQEDERPEWTIEHSWAPTTNVSFEVSEGTWMDLDVSPDGRTIVFMSNKDQEKKRYFSLYAMNLDGSGIRRLTEGAHFDGFPHFSPDGRRLVFVSDRNATSRRDLNVFLADWR